MEPSLLITQAIAIPLILASLIKGVSDLQDISKLSQMGGRTILTYVTTTLIAVTIGLILVNTIQPGKSISVDTRQELVEAYQVMLTKNAKLQRNNKRQVPYKLW